MKPPKRRDPPPPVSRAQARQPKLRSSRKRRLTASGLAVRVLALLLLLWGSGFLWFSLTLPQPAPLSDRTDAVVVLTGGEGRLKRGLAVLEAGAAQRMLVSGVDRGTTRRDLAAAAGVSLGRLASTDLGYGASDTRTNAAETARWARNHGFASLRLVTSAGHMRRARLELGRVLPAGIIVVEDAVPVEAATTSVAFEYSKYLLRRSAVALGAA